MEISNFYGNLNITDVQEKAAPVGDSLRVAVTKTSAQGKAAQSATPNLMSFSTDENSIWFNGKKYGVYILKGLENLSTDSNTGVIQSFLGDFTYDRWVDAVNTGNIVFVETNNILIPASVYANNSEDLNIMFVTPTYTYFVSIHYSTGSGYSISLIQQDSLVRVADVNNTLTNSSTDKPLSAAMGKKLQDEKLAKTDVVNNLTTDEASKALSAAQGKALNDKFNGNKININFSATSNSTDNATIKGYMGNIDGATLVRKLTYGANLVDSSSDDWVITLQEVSSTKVSFTGIRFAGFNLYSKNISVTISGSNYTKMTVAQGNRVVPAINNTLTSTSTSEALSAAQGKALNDRISGLGNVYRVRGTKTNLSDVLALTDAKVGDVWNVTNAFTLGGKPYPANTNVVCLVATSTSDHDENNWDPIGGTVDLSPYAKKTEVEESDNKIWEQLNVVVNKDEIVNNLTSTNTDKPLSAAMGKKLQDEKLSKTDANNTYLTKVNAESTYAKKADGISHYSIGELTALSSNPTQEQLKTALGTPSAFRNAIDAGKLILVTGNANVQSQKSATCIIDSGNVIVKYLYPGNNDWTVIAKCVPASSGDNWDNAQFSVRIVKPLNSAGIIIE